MKTAATISIGNELLSGKVLDSNRVYLSGRLLSAGIATVAGFTVPDEQDAIVEAIAAAAAKADIILITGGLGPTDDDITRAAVAKFLNVGLTLNKDLLSEIISFFDKRKIAMPERNKVQAYLPKGTEPLGNALGTAPGILARFDGKIIAAMPGVPIEMKAMFERDVLPLIEAIGSDEILVIKKINCFGTGESSIADDLGDLMARGRNPQINCTVSTGIITLHICATAKDKSQAAEMIEQDRKVLYEKVGEFIFSEDDKTLSQVIGEKLTDAGKTLSTAESCTGGLIAKMITDTAGASAYFKSGWISYSNEAKIAELGIEEDIIERYGAVSVQTAEAMAKGARTKSGADFAISCTGIAGPTGGSADKPVGLVYIAIDSAAGTECYKYNFARPDRNFVRTRTAQTALNLLRLKL